MNATIFSAQKSAVIEHNGETRRWWLALVDGHTLGYDLTGRGSYTALLFGTRGAAEKAAKAAAVYELKKNVGGNEYAVA